ncbi:MAG: hypothetical protein IT267_10765 [Saprospiraceae bacterium]|nr:hypothetical protein [Saprospiraceae bacterium]
MIDFLAYPDDARIWIYASDSRIDDYKIPHVQQIIKEFCLQWTSHREDLVTTGGILHNYFIVLIVDQHKNPPGGCALDNSIHFIKKLGSELNVDFLNRNIVHYIINENVYSVHLDNIKEALQKATINEDTRFFDNLVSSKKEFIKNWVIPFKNSWIKRLID